MLETLEDAMNEAASLLEVEAARLQVVLDAVGLSPVVLAGWAAREALLSKSANLTGSTNSAALLKALNLKDLKKELKERGGRQEGVSPSGDAALPPTGDRMISTSEPCGKAVEKPRKAGGKPKKIYFITDPGADLVERYAPAGARAACPGGSPALVELISLFGTGLADVPGVLRAASRHLALSEGLVTYHRATSFARQWLARELKSRPHAAPRKQIAAEALGVIAKPVFTKVFEGEVEFAVLACPRCQIGRAVVLSVHRQSNLVKFACEECWKKEKA